MLGVDVGALVNTRQESALPVLRFLNRIAAGAHHHKSGHVLVVAAQAVGHPRAEAGTHLARLAAIHEQQRRLVIGHVGLHRANDTDVINAGGRLFEELADLDAALSVFFELEGGPPRGTGLALGVVVDGDLLAMPAIERGLGIEGVDVRGPSIGEDVDDALGPA